jgi:hypothetical protein
MVKNIVPVNVRRADLEAQYRTLPVSQKPAIGKSLFSNIELDGNFQVNFNGERFIHQDVRQYLKRRAADLVAQTVQTRTALNSGDNDKSNRYWSLEVLSRHLASEKSAFQALGKLPKQLRALVIAQVLNDCGFQLNNCGGKNLSFTKDQLKTKVALRRQLATLRLALVQNNIRNAVNEFGLNMEIASIFNSFTLTSRNLGSPSKILGFAFESLHDGVGSKKERCMSTVDMSRCVLKTAGDRFLIWLRKESGFGTAPIWYQQSMENGPPILKHNLPGSKIKNQKQNACHFNLA